MNAVIPFRNFRLQIFPLFIFVLLLLVSACNPLSTTTSLEKIQKRGEIRMGTISGSLTYSYDGSQHSGFDYELGEQFSSYLNVHLRVNEYDTLSSLFDALENDKIDFIGSGLTLTPKRAQKYRSSPPYYYVSQKVVYHKGTYRPREVADINAPVGVLKGSSHEETLERLFNEAPNLKINALEGEDQESLLRQVADKEIKFAIVNSSTLAQKQRYYPALAEAFTISGKEPVAWLINRNQDDSLYAAMIEFMGNKYQDQSIAKLEEKYFGHVQHFDYVDMRIFLKKLKSVLPKYEALFKEHATTEVDWLLLAVVSYQESHWNPRARSPTGVRGLMMLTLNTADHLGVENRLDPEQSIAGGAKYLSQQIKRLPDSIADDEKVWFALASYNIGYGHVMDARRITAMKKQNPNAWSDVKDNLPLLHQKKWYKKTRYGYARGQEAQHYVNNIRQYRKTMNWFIAGRNKQLEEQKARQTARDKALAEELALQEEEALAAAQALQTPLTKEEALEQAKALTLTRETALMQATEAALALESALQQAKEKALAEKDALQQAKQKTLIEENALQHAKDNLLAIQETLEQAQENALAEEKRLQETREKALAEQLILQQATDNALAEQQDLQEAKKKALAEQQSAQQAKDNAFSEQQKLQQSSEQKTPQEADEGRQSEVEEKA
ncbi:membrane-bound lytic murein transglycosylase MltF [Psychromonas antarctica]|uniref:membrane-bound lytic murein transglycosylase MltF n=1 Tax=Psychromonas antarctica TaxID=67573 RepID=UPI001EE7BAEC|nr:membrane-bound lytic murein transglycosylase MltF [Psychromonas antarctica]MCG6201836.1 membrane-bound lytic murein transglycosylase MltF [Psychromonas antarctica]